MFTMRDLSSHLVVGKDRRVLAYVVRFLVLAMPLLSLPATQATERPGRGPHSPSGPTGTPILSILNVNNFTSFYRADGQGNHQVDDQAGGRFPRGTATCLYEDGFMWGGKVYLDSAHTLPPPFQRIRVGGQTYNQGTRPGWIIGRGANATAVPPSDPRARIYRIRRDYYTMSDAELRADAATLNLISESDVTQAQMDAVRAQYNLDWLNWPVDLGAPYVERNRIPGYQIPPPFSITFTADSLIPGGYDEPGVGGNVPADQVIWTVYNDLDRNVTLGLYLSEPLGLEGQVTIWGYKRTDAVGNLHFKRLRLINKGGVDIGGGVRGAFYIDSMYVSQWSDPDVGDSGDDVCGTDTLLGLGYAYNGHAIDAQYQQYGLAPPGVGYQILAGPLVPSPGDTGVFDFRRIINKKNLPMTAFVYFSAGSPITDPLLGYQSGASYESTLEWWRMFRGLRPDSSSVPERYYPFPPGFTPGPFCLTGDPVQGTGFLDGLGTSYSFEPGDRRTVPSSGPFSLAFGDTQEVVVEVVAGIGADRLSSISLMKSNAQIGRGVFIGMISPLTGVEELRTNVPSAIQLSQNYPNPFNPSTTIKYQLLTQSHVTLKMFDVLGREVTTLVDDVEQPGYKAVTWNARSVASGVYFCRLQAGSFVETKKLVLTK